MVAAFAGRRFPLRAYGGAWAGQLRWGRLTHARVLGILKNPGYAGAYVFGRYASHRTVDPSGTVHTAMTERPRAEWPVLIKDHHEGYITWAEYLASEARLAANHTAAGARPPREGTALCQGIIICGSCGKPMMTNYHTDQRPSYECSSRRDRLTTPSCRTVAAACVDDAVAGALLDALTPGQIVLALSAADEVSGRRQRVSRAAELAVERARYDADRAERAFCQVEPENRLVARSLEARWEARLAALAEAEQALEAAQDTLPPLPSRDDLEKLAADLPALWNAPTTSARDRKRLLRTLIADVTVLPEPDRSKVTDRDPLAHRRHRRAHRRQARPPRHRQANSGRRGRARQTARAGHQQRRAGHPAQCRRAPYRPRPAIRHRCGPVDPPRLQGPGPGSLRPRRDLRGRGRPAAGLQHQRHLPLDPHRAADRPPRLRQPVLHPLGRPGRGRLPHQDRPVRPPGPGRPPPHAPRTRVPRAGGGEISVTEAACQLGCSTGVIYYWIETGQLTARRGSGNRLHIPWNDQIQANAAPHRPIRASQPRRPPHQAPQAPLRQPGMSAPPAMLTSPARRTRA